MRTALEHCGCEVIVPTQDVLRRGRGKGRPAERRTRVLLPGYMPTKFMAMDWELIRMMPSVLGVVGFGDGPSRLSRGVVSYFRHFRVAELKPKTLFLEGDVIKIKGSPLNHATITIAATDVGAGVYRCDVTLFGGTRVISVPFERVEALT